MNEPNLKQAIVSTFNSLGYSDQLITKAVEDLEKVIAIRYYNKLASLLPAGLQKDIPSDDYQQVIKHAGETIDPTTLQDQLLEITREVIIEYVDSVSE